MSVYSGPTRGAATMTKPSPQDERRFKMSDWVDVRSGLIGAFLLAMIVLAINWSHGPLAAGTSAAKQFVYTSIFGSLIVALTTRISRSRGPKALVLSVATLLPSVLTILAVTAVHHLRGTPEPVLSVIPTAVLAPVSFFFWARRMRILDPLRGEGRNVDGPGSIDASVSFGDAGAVDSDPSERSSPSTADPSAFAGGAELARGVLPVAQGIRQPKSGGGATMKRRDSQ